MVKTLQLAEASLIQPFSYLQLVFASFIGVIFFSNNTRNDIDWNFYYLITAGLFTFWREYKIKLIKITIFSINFAS